MDSRIIQPGQPRGVSGAEAINLILKQMNQFAMELNIINLRLQVIQNLVVAKKLVTEPELEAEWNKLMEEAKALAMRAKLVSPDGGVILPSAPQKPQDGPVGGPAGATGDVEPTAGPNVVGHA
jgi:hypothetical protein